MDLWIPVTVAAALFQTLRFMLQKALSVSSLSATGATFARFVYSAPLILMGLGLWFWITGTDLPETNARFWLFASLGGLTQILATVFVVLLFRERNFAVGITFKNTEVIQTALVGVILLGEGGSFSALLAMLIGLLAVLILSKPPDVEGHWWDHLRSRAVALGLASGVFFAVSGVSYRGASLELAADAPLRAAVTLAAVVTLQTLVMASWMAFFEPGQINAVWRARKRAVFIGFTSMAGSFCWFWAITLQIAAYVNALGQIELVFSMAVTLFFFKEKISLREYLGIGLLAVSIVTLVLVI